MLRFACPHCKATVSAPEEKVGVRVYCPRCRQPFQVPGAPSGAVPSISTSGPPPKPSALATPPTLAPGATTPQAISQPVPQPAETPSTSSPRRPRPLHVFTVGLVVGLIVGALLGGGIVWAILARQWGHWH